MNSLNALTPAKGSVKKAKRIGRGQGSGHGQSATRGTKGQQSRTGYQRKIGFEGGQQPLQKRVPKIGFFNFRSKKFKAVNLLQIQKLADEKNILEFDPAVLAGFGLVSGHKKIKILGAGKLRSKISVKAHAFSGSAKAAIESAGGSAILMK